MTENTIGANLSEERCGNRTIISGDILEIDKIKHPVLVASKDFFNTSGEIIDDTIQSIFEYI